MNDCLFIIDQPPRPSNDHINPDHDVNVIAKVSDLGPSGDRHAVLLAAAPELLAACQAARIALNHSDNDETLGMLAAAIAKAMGKDADV
jgi:hypothetical protein